MIVNIIIGLLLYSFLTLMVWIVSMALTGGCLDMVDNKTGVKIILWPISLVYYILLFLIIALKFILVYLGVGIWRAINEDIPKDIKYLLEL